MKTREITSLLKAFTSIYKYLKGNNLKPKLYVMDNEMSIIIEKYIINKNNTKLQFVEPQSHRVNAAERAV